jgi:zinc transporter
MSGDAGLVNAHLLDGKGGARHVLWDEILAWKPEDGVIWVHLDRSQAGTGAWLERDSGLDPLVVSALLAEETRPRCSVLPKGLLIILRGVNLNPGADPEDMVSLRMWLGGGRVITLRKRRLMAVQDIHEELEAGSGPTTAGGIVVALADRLAERIGPVVVDLDDTLDRLEVQTLDSAPDELRPHLAQLRRETIALRRHIAPQRDALASLCTASTDLLSDHDRMRLREVGDRVTRYVEDLDALRERAAVTNDELGTQLAETMNRRMYTLSLVAAVFLPLGLLTGLLGINVGGIPGTQNQWAFTVVTLLLLAIGVGVGWWLRKRQLF